MTAAAAFCERVPEGWQIDKAKGTDWRTVSITRDCENFTFRWELNAGSGNYVFARGLHTVGGADWKFSEDWTNLAKSLRIAAEPVRSFTEKPDGSGYNVVPFDPDATPDDAIKSILAGQRITWINSISNFEDEAELPWNGKHTIVDGHAPRRTISFADPGAGFRTVRLNAITNVEKGSRPCPR